VETHTVWLQSIVLSYLIKFEVYQGTNPLNLEYERGFGKSAAPLVQMISELPEHCSVLPYRFYFDSLFICQTLLVHLQECGYADTGMICENCVP
jgi:hypothetical protein